MAMINEITDQFYNFLAPSVYIDNVVVDNGNANVHFHLEDNSNEWINNKTVLESLFVNITLVSTSSFQEAKSSLLDVSKNFFNNQYSGKFTFVLDQNPNVHISASCGNTNIKGPETVEKIRAASQFVTSSVNGNSYQNISKIIDLNLLNFNLVDNSVIRQISSLASESVGSTTVLNLKKEIVNDEFLISYRPEKKANIGFVFDLESFLENNSAFYNTFKSYNDFKYTILLNSKVDIDYSAAYKKNVSLRQEDYTKINSQFNTYVLNESGSKIFVSLTDDNNSVTDNSFYKLKIDLAVKDFSYSLFVNEIKNKLNVFKNTIIKYEQLFTEYAKNKLIKDINKYIFENDYDSRKTELKQAIEGLSQLYAFINSAQKSVYVKLFVSAFHPLITNSSLLNKIIKKIEDLETVLYPLAREIDYLGDTSNVKLINSLALLKKEYTLNTEYDFDYNYEENYGFEVFSTDSLSLRRQEPTNGIRLLSNTAEKDARKLLEARKYLLNPTFNDINNNSYLSACVIDLGPVSYNLNVISQQTGFYDELFIKLLEFVNEQFRYPRLQSAYMQLSSNGISINTISNNLNNSVNNLFKSTIFDPNLDSQQASLQFVASTGVEKILILSSKDSITGNLREVLPKDSLQFKAAFENTNINVGVLPFNNTTNPLPANSTIALFTYKVLFKDNKIYDEQNSNYGVYSLDSTDATTDLLKQKIRQFNKHYIVFKKQPVNPTTIVESVDFSKELDLNIRPKFFNRSVKTPIIVNGIESL